MFLNSSESGSNPSYCKVMPYNRIQEKVPDLTGSGFTELPNTVEMPIMEILLSKFLTIETIVQNIIDIHPYDLYIEYIFYILIMRVTTKCFTT